MKKQTAPMRNPALIAPAAEPYKPVGENLAKLQGAEKREAWEFMQRQSPEFARLVTDFSKVFGKPEEVRFEAAYRIP